MQPAYSGHVALQTFHSLSHAHLATVQSAQVVCAAHTACRGGGGDGGEGGGGGAGAGGSGDGGVGFGGEGCVPASGEMAGA